MSSAVEAVVRVFGLEPPAVAPPPPPLRSNRRSRSQAAFVSLSPADPVVMTRGVVNLQARLVFSDLSGLDVTEEAAWTSSAPDIAFVDANPGRRGRLIGISAGVARLFASAGGKVGWTTVTVLEG